MTGSTGELETFKKGVVLVEINGAQILDADDVSQNLYSGINRFMSGIVGNTGSLLTVYPE